MNDLLYRSYPFSCPLTALAVTVQVEVERLPVLSAMLADTQEVSPRVCSNAVHCARQGLLAQCPLRREETG